MCQWNDSTGQCVARVPRRSAAETLLTRRVGKLTELFSGDQFIYTYITEHEIKCEFERDRDCEKADPVWTADQQ